MRTSDPRGRVIALSFVHRLIGSSDVPSSQASVCAWLRTDLLALPEDGQLYSVLSTVQNRQQPLCRLAGSTHGGDA